ncbi:hypothetical protein, partial [Pantoea agglomerans]
RFVGTTSKPKVPRERREDGPAAAEVLRPALRLDRPEKKLPRLTVTAFTNLILTLISITPAGRVFLWLFRDHCVHNRQPWHPTCIC